MDPGSVKLPINLPKIGSKRRRKRNVRVQGLKGLGFRDLGFIGFRGLGFWVEARFKARERQAFVQVYIARPKP